MKTYAATMKTYVLEIRETFVRKKTVRARSRNKALNGARKKDRHSKVEIRVLYEIPESADEAYEDCEWETEGSEIYA